MTKLLTLEEWAKRRYAKPPKLKTLRRWVHDAKIRPLPQKEGRGYVVREDAVYVDWRNVDESQEAQSA